MDLVLTRIFDQLKLYLILLLVSFVCIGSDLAGWADGVKGVLGVSIVSVQDTTNRSLEAVMTPVRAIQDFEQLERELYMTREQLTTAYVNQAEIQRLRQENEDLRKLQGVDIGDDIGVRMVARVIEGSDGVYLNKGTRDGIEENMVIVDPQGILVGKVEGANPYLSKIMLVIDRESVIGLRVLGRVTTGVLVGDSFRGIMQEVLQTDLLEVDDVLVTTGSDGVYPEGLVVGEVESVEGVESDVTKSAIVHWQADIGETVFVLK